MKKLIQCMLVFLFLSTNAFAADLCVSVSGGGDGTDWNGGCLTWSSFTPVRGNTYFVADGSYGGKDFSSQSGTSSIVVRKAIETNHGTSISNWASTYGDGQATFSSHISIGASYFELNGAKRNENDWSDHTAYGFYINTGSYRGIYWPNSNTDTIVKYVAIVGNSQDIDRGMFDMKYGCDGCGANASGSNDNVTISHCLGKDASAVTVFMTEDDTILLEYNYFWGNVSGGVSHGEMVQTDVVTNLTIRYNYWRDAEGTGIIMLNYDDGVYIYGNVFYDVGWGVTDGAIAENCPNCFPHGTCITSNVKIYNNSFVDLSDLYNVGLTFCGGSNRTSANNIWSGNLATVSIGTDTSYTNSTNLSTSYFDDYPGDIFTLSIDTPGGTTLTNLTEGGRLQTYTTDMNGNLYDQGDGNWSRGAYAFGDEVTPANAIQGVTIN